MNEPIPPATVSEILGTDPNPEPVAPPVDPQPVPPRPPVDTDAKGVPFDPERHVRAKHPKTGSWMPRRRPAVPPPAATGAGAATGAPVPPPDMSDIERAARGPQSAAPGDAGTPTDNATVETAIGLIQILLVLAGDEEGVLSPAEKLLLRPPLLRIMKKYEIGADVLPAEVELLFALAGIVIERIKRGGKTATTFAKVKAWLAGVLFRHRGAQIGAQMRREVPSNLVAGLQAQVAKLSAELEAAKAANVQPAAGGVA